jgi:hypothetical protein
MKKCLFIKSLVGNYQKKILDSIEFPYRRSDWAISNHRRWYICMDIGWRIVQMDSWGSDRWMCWCSGCVWYRLVAGIRAMKFHIWNMGSE